MPDKKTIIKYLKVKALAEAGVGGERANAQAMKDRMEAKFPGIEAKARKHQQRQSGKIPFPFEGNWEPLFGWFNQAAQAAYGYAQQAAQAQVGAVLAHSVDSYIRQTRRGRWLIAFRLEAETVDQMHRMTPAQYELFRAELHHRLEKELDDLLALTEDC